MTTTPETIQVRGYAVMWGSPEFADLSPEKDYFTRATDLGTSLSKKAALRFHHGRDEGYRDRGRLGTARILPADDLGLPIEAGLELRDGRDRALARWIESGKIGLSSGAAYHTIHRVARANGTHELKEWILIPDISLTLVPADARQVGTVRIVGAGEGRPASPAVKAWRLADLDRPSLAAPPARDDIAGERKVVEIKADGGPAATASPAEWADYWEAVHGEYVKKADVHELRRRWSRHRLDAGLKSLRASALAADLAAVEVSSRRLKHDCPGLFAPAPRPRPRPVPIRHILVPHARPHP
jgi:hypothetical protein